MFKVIMNPLLLNKIKMFKQYKNKIIKRKTKKESKARFINRGNIFVVIIKTKKMK